MSRIPRRLAGIGASDLENNAEFDSYVGPAREITVDPARGIIALHDGVTPGGQQFLKGGGGGDIGINPIPKSFAGIAGDNKTYTLDEAPITAGNVFVYVGGIRQVPGTDYTVSGLTLTILSNPDGLEVDTLLIAGPFALTTLQGKVPADFATALQGLQAETALQPGEAATVEQGNTADRLAALNPTLADYGYVIGSTAPQNDAIAAMKAALGYIVFPRGAVVLNTMTIDVPSFFEIGASIAPSIGQTITFTSRIESPRQTLFGGLGSILLRIDGTANQGEDARLAHASWWGIYPQNNNPDINQKPLFDKAMASLAGQTREGRFKLDNGAYRLNVTDGPVGIPRGIWFEGDGTRRTTFDIISSGANKVVFATLDVAVKFSGFQFETPNEDGSVAFDGTQIQVNHPDCTIEDVSIWSARRGIQINANNCKIRNIRGVYGADVETAFGGTSLVEFNASYAFIDGVYVVGTRYGPGAIFRVGVNAPANLNGVVIRNVTNTEDTNILALSTSQYSAYDIQISGINDFRDAGATKSAFVFNCSVSNGAYNINISDYVGNGNVPTFAKLTQAGTASIRGISVSTINCPGSGIAFDLTAVTNTGIYGIRVDDSCQFGSRRNAYSGVHSQCWWGGSLSKGEIVIADDAVGIIIPPEIGGELQLFNMGKSVGSFPNVAHSGCIAFDVGTSPALAKYYGGANLLTLAVGTVPNGTTGTDTNTNVSVDASGNIYIENRSGDPVTYRYDVRH